MHSLRLLVILLAGFAVIAGCSSNGQSNAERDVRGSTETTIPFEREGVLTFHRGSPLGALQIDIEIAETDSARNRGLMQRESLPEKSGMLFIFDREEERSFWMANTPLALDILFVNSARTVVSISKYTKPLSSNQITSGSPAQYVIEVPAGFTDTYGITEGTKVTWKRTSGNRGAP